MIFLILWENLVLEIKWYILLPRKKERDAKVCPKWTNYYTFYASQTEIWMYVWTLPGINTCFFGDIIIDKYTKAVLLWIRVIYLFYT